MNPRICPETKRPKETLEKTKCPACCAGHCELKECSMPEICPQSLQSLPNPISNQAKKEPNSTLPNSSNCPIACPNCCDDDACGADEQKYCYECCPSPAKERKLGLACNPVNTNCLSNRDCCSGQCQVDGSKLNGKCAERNDGRLKKEGEVCGQSCGEDCGECEAGLTCIQSISPSCRCGTCKHTFS